jgi:hypothetical protein
MRSGIEDGLRCPFTVILADSSTTGAGIGSRRRREKKSFLWMIEGILGRRCTLQAANSPMSHHSNFSSDVCMRGRISEDTVVP